MIPALRHRLRSGAARAQGAHDPAPAPEERVAARRTRARVRSQGRLLLLSAMFLAAFVAVGTRMGMLALSDLGGLRSTGSGAAIRASRADITDRDGRILSTNLVTHALYAQPEAMIDKARAARALAEIFPDLDRERLLEDFTGDRTFLWLRKKLSPEQKQAVQNIGDPGLRFGPRKMRLYPNGRLAAHVLGGAGFGREGVHAAELVGKAGIEKAMDDRLRDPAQAATPLRLSLDLSVQAATRRVLAGGMHLLNAKGAAAVLMKADTGEIVSLVSLPDFDPNDRPVAKPEAAAGDSPLFDRAVQGLYELGSVFKIFTAAQALDTDMVTPSTMIDTEGPLTWGKYRIRDFHNLGPELSVTDVVVESSNVGAARIAKEIGPERQKEFLRKLGLLDPMSVELVEAAGAQPLLPKRWSELSAMTIAFGHGLSVSPLHLAAAYATLVNGGRKVDPTLLAGRSDAPGPRVVGRDTSRTLRHILRQVVERGTASMAEVAGYAVGGKTGTASKPTPTGGYSEDKNIATFGAVFPADDPAYVLVVMLDEPVETSGPQPRRTAGWTAVPVAAEIIRRAAPLMGLRPEIEPAPAFALTRRME